MNVRQIIFLVLAIIFLVLGVIGLVLPVIPQIPFLVTGVVFLAGSLPPFKRKLLGTKLYREHGARIVSRFKILQRILGEEEMELMVKVAEEMQAEGKLPAAGNEASEGNISENADYCGQSTGKNTA